MANASNFFNTAYTWLGNYHNQSNPSTTSGSVNELSDEDLKKRRNKQLIIWVSITVVVIGAIMLLNVVKTKKAAKNSQNSTQNV